MAATLGELLQPIVILDVFSRLRRGRGPLGSWLGFQPSTFDPATATVSGPNTMKGEGSLRTYTYRFFDHTRVPMKLRAPGTGPAVVAQNPLGQNTISIARFHQKIPLLYEFLGQLAPMIGPQSRIDAGGQDYLMRQTKFLAEQANNTVEFLAAGMLRDSLFYVQSGDNWLPQFTAGTGSQVTIQIPFNVPSTNKNQLANTMGTASGTLPIIQVAWNNPNAPIIGNIQSIVAAYALLNRYMMTEAWINSTMWTNILLNNQVRNAAGSANKPFATWVKKPDPGWSNTGPDGMFTAEITGVPYLTWHFCDDALAFGTDIDPSYATVPTGSVPAAANLQKLIPDTMCIFAPVPDQEWVRLVLGGEMVVENEGQPAALRQGWYFWHQYKTQPSSIELLALLNCVPILPLINIIAPATVVF